MASEVGAPPTFTLAVTWSRRGSIRDPVPEYWLATHTDPAPTARAAGPLPTGIRARTVSVPGSTRETVESRLSATHSDPAANASAAGPSPTRTRLVTLPVAGSIFSTAASSYPATQTAPSPIATASGCTSRDTVRPGDPVAGSTSNNRSADGSVTHSRPRPNPIAPRPDPRQRDRLGYALGLRVDPGDRRPDRARHPDRAPTDGDAPGLTACEDLIHRRTGRRSSLASRAPPASTPNLTCAATWSGAPSVAWTRWPHDGNTWSFTSVGCRKCAGSSRPRRPAGSPSPPGSTGRPSSTAPWSTHRPSTCAVPRCPPSHRPSGSPTCSSRPC